MPQSTNLSDKWVNALGENWNEIYGKYLHTIGNLSLTRYNSEMNNKFFTEKREMQGGFKDSSCWLNKGLKDLNTWNENEIVKRAKILAISAINICPLPTIKDVKKDYNIVLDFEDKWKSKKPKYFIFMDEKHEINDITHLYVEAITLMYNFDPEFFLETIDDELIINKRMFSFNEDAFHWNSSKLADTNLFINTNFNSDTKRNNLLCLIKLDLVMMTSPSIYNSFQ